MGQAKIDTGRLCCPWCFERHGRTVTLTETQRARAASLAAPYALIRRYVCRGCGTRFASVERLGFGVLRRAIGAEPIAREELPKEQKQGEGQNQEQDEPTQSEGEGGA